MTYMLILNCALKLVEEIILHIILLLKVRFLVKYDGLLRN